MSDLYFLDPSPSGGPAVLLLHGLGVNCESWALQFEPLANAGLRPIAPDLPGFGKSPYNETGWNFRRIASQLTDLLDELKTGPAHIVGLSMGGVLAQQMALDYPEQVRKLTLVSTFAALRPDSISQWIYFAQRLFLTHVISVEKQAGLVARRIFPRPEEEPLRVLMRQQIAAANPQAYRAAMRSLGWFDSRLQLGSLKIPTLVITGEEDSTVSPARQEQLARLIPGARQVKIAGAGHAVSVEKAQEFNEALLGFLL